MIGRFAAAFILLSQALLLLVVLDPTGSHAIAFSFVGHPALAVGFVLALVSLARRGAIWADPGREDPGARPPREDA